MQVTLLKLRHGNRARAAVTLPELLAGVGILACLLAVVVPLFGRGVVMAQQSKCAGNMRQIGAALLLHANDNDGRLPGTTHELGVNYEKAWIFALKPYIDGMDEVRICPADPRGAERLAANGTSYILNSFVFVPKIGPFGERMPGSLNNIRAIPQPSKTLFATNISDKQGISAQSDHTHSERWGGSEPGKGSNVAGSWDRVCADIQPDRFTTNARDDHTNGSANYLFADGHVENIPAITVKERLMRGDNIARPPGI